MFLNDAFDVEFDQQFRIDRPIPSGRITVEAAWRWGLLFLGVGGACWIALGKVTGAIGLVLAICIICYNAFHKGFVLSPLLLGICRMCLYLASAATASVGVTGTTVWCAIALAGYVIGLSYFARRETLPGPLQYWPVLFLIIPIGLALLLNADGYRGEAALLSFILALWMVRSLRQAWFAERNMGRAVSMLLAGIVFVDWLAVADAPRNFGFIFLPLFGCALLLQRFVPAT